MSNAVFLEYRFNPEIDDYNKIADRLNSMGFNKRSEHQESGVELWIQSRAIFLLMPDFLFSEPGQIMGLGTLSNDHPMDIIPDVYLDENTDFYARECDNGFKFYFTETDSLNHLYKEVNGSKVKGSGINSFTGLVINTTSEEIPQLLCKIAEKVEQSDSYTKYVFANKFTVFVNSKNNSGATMLISESSDVFATTSYMITRDVELLQFDNCIEEDCTFGSLDPMIIGYNCRAFGNNKSYSIENYIPMKDFNVDIVYRTRKQYIKIKESTLEYYDSLIS